MTARGGDLHRAPRLLLALDLAEVHIQLGSVGGFWHHAHRRQHRLAFQVAEHFAQRSCRVDVEFPHQRSLGRVVARDDQPAQAQSPRGQRDGQYARHRPHAAVEREFAQQHRPIQPSADLLGRRQNAYRHGQVERRPLFAHVSGRQVHGDLAGGDLVVRIPDGGPHAFLRLLHGSVGQANNGKRRQPAPDVDLHVDGVRVQTLHCGRPDFSQHTASSPAAF